MSEPLKILNDNRLVKGVSVENATTKTLTSGETEDVSPKRVVPAKERTQLVISAQTTLRLLQDLDAADKKIVELADLHNADIRDIQAVFDGQVAEISSLKKRLALAYDESNKTHTNLVTQVSKARILSEENAKLADRVDELERKFTFQKSNAEAGKPPTETLTNLVKALEAGGYTASASGENANSEKTDGRALSDQDLADAARITG